MTIAKVKNTYFLWADIIRVLAIFLVVGVHTSFLPEAVNLNSVPDFIFFAIYKTCVPLFVMLSGALLLGKTETYKTFFDKRIKKVLIPWIIWTIIYVIYNVNFHHIQIQTLGQWKSYFYQEFLTQLWFLPLIFGLYIFTPFYRMIAQKVTSNEKLYFISLWIMFIALLPFIHTSVTFPLPESTGLLSTIFEYSGYYFLGFFISKIKIKKNYILIALASFFIGLTLTILNIFLDAKLTMNTTYNFFFPGTAFASVSIFYLLFAYFQNIKLRTNALNTVKIISKASFGIYILHFFIRDLILNPLTVLFQSVGINFPILSLILAIIIFSITAIVVIFLQKIPLTKYIFP